MYADDMPHWMKSHGLTELRPNKGSHSKGIEHGEKKDRCVCFFRHFQQLDFEWAHIYFILKKKD